MAVEMRINPGGECLEVVAKTGVVDKAFLCELIELIARNRAATEPSPRRILVVSDATAAAMSVFDVYEVWEHATRRGLSSVSVAYVVKGRPLTGHHRFAQSIAHRRGISLRFFDDRAKALEWLTATRFPDARREAATSGGPR